MSLRVWLPLNGNLNNQGLNNEEIIAFGNPTSSSDGKIGKCYSFDGSDDSIFVPFNSFINEEWSISVWFYKNTIGNKNYQTIFGGISGFEIEARNVAETSPVIVAWNWGKGTIPYEFNKWNHLVVTRNTSETKWYLNGELKLTGDAGSIPIGNYFIGAWNSSSQQNFEGKMNDFRIYDHCLSAKEVKEISKGLICHYPLKSQYETGQVNKYSGDVAEGYLTGHFTRTKLEDERGYNYKLEYTGTGSNMWAAMSAEYFSFTVGKKYYYSCKVRCHSTNFGLYLRASRSDNDWVTNMTNVLNPDGEWHECVVSQTINSTYDRSGSTVTCNPILEFWTDNLSTSGTVYSADFDIKDVQVIESDCYVPFIDNDMVSDVVSDCSGYGNNGTKVGNIAWSSDSARYSGSYFFNVSGIYKDNINLTLSDFTISYWLKRDSTTGSDKMFFGSNSSSSVNSTWYHYGDNSFKFPLGEFYYNHNAGSKGDLLNQWVLFTFVYDGSTLKVYRNSVYEGSKSFSGNVLLSNLSVGIGYDNSGYWGHASMSDFRIYTTALSEEDIKALYSTSASIDKTGVLSAYEFCEEG